MAGILGAIRGGLQTARDVALDTTAAGQRQQQIDQEGAAQQQRAAMEQQEMALRKKEADYQDSTRQLGALKTQGESLVTAAQPDIAVLKHADTLTGDERAKYEATDEYKKAHDNYHGKGGTGEQLADIGQQVQQHLDTIAGRHMAMAQAKAPKTAFDISQYGWKGVGTGDAYDYVTSVSGRPASDFIRRGDQASSVEQSIAALQQGIQSGNLNGLDPHVTQLLAPLLNSHMGNAHPAGGVIGPTSITGISSDPSNPQNVILHTAHAQHLPDGTTNMHGSPQGEGVSVPISEALGYVGKLTQIANQVDDPEAQRKLREAEDNGDTAIHRVFKDVAAAGLPGSSMYAPAPGIKTVPGGYVEERPGEAKFVQTVKKETTATQRQQFIDIISDPNSTEGEKQEAIQQLTAISAAEKGYSGAKDPNLRSIGGRYSPDEFKAHVADLVSRGLVTRSEGDAMEVDFAKHKTGDKPGTVTTSTTTTDAAGNKSTHTEKKPATAKDKMTPADIKAAVKAGKMTRAEGIARLSGK